VPYAPLTIVIPTTGTPDLIEPLLEDLNAQTLRPRSVHVVVNNRRGSVRARRWHMQPGIDVSFLSPSYYFTKGVNVALRGVRTKYVAIANDDIRLPSTWTEAVTEALDGHPQYGSIASRVRSLRYPGLLDCCGDSLYTSGHATNNGWRMPLDAWMHECEVFSASGCLATYHTSDVRRAGCFDEHFVAYMEDVDLGFRLQLLGRPCLYAPTAEASHVGGATRRTHTRAARLVERNSLLTVIKNFPSRLLRSAMRELLCGQLRPCSFEGHRSFAAWGWGKRSALAMLPHAMEMRSCIQRSRVVSDHYVESLLRRGRPLVCHL
jgi:GT2 family glycosyltransferase